MSPEPRKARDRGNDLARGIDPDALDSNALVADIGRATEVPGPEQLHADCIRAAYEAIAAVGESADAPDDATLVSLRSGARAAADAARVADEIGAGAGAALRAAARAWYPFAVEGEDVSWRAGLKAFSTVCDAGAETEAGRDIVVHAVAAASEATRGDDTATSRAVQAFSNELQRRTAAGEDLPTAWRSAARHASDEAPEPVFQVVVEAVQGVLDR